MEKGKEISLKSKSLWAKKRTEDGVWLWLPLMAHLIDTENTIGWLLNHWLSEGTKSWLIEGIGNEDELRKLVKFLGIIHDIGKATPAFQTIPSYNGDRELDNELVDKLVQSKFVDLDQISLSSPRKSPHAMAGEAILEDLGVPESIGSIIGGHHGDAGENPPYNQINDYRANYYQHDKDPRSDNNVPEVCKIWRNVQKEIFEYGLSQAGYQSVKDIPDINQSRAVVLEGLLITADWFASSEFLGSDRSKKLFPLISLDETFDDIDLQARFENAIETWNIGENWEPKKVSLDEDPYQKRWGFNARPVQRVITETIDQANDPGMVIIEAPMGLGKTEISLVATEQLAYATKRSGLFWGLPTQATSNAMFNRVLSWLETLAKDQNENFPVKLLHGKAQFNSDYENLPNASNIEDTGAVVVNDWFSGKKSTLANFTVGTIDMLLLMALKQKHLFLRHLGFSGKVVVIDEVHAYDSYMSQYLYMAIEWLGAYRVPMVILSATLPKEKRQELIASYYRGKYRKSLDLNEDWAKAQAYPLLTVLDGTEVKQVTHFEGHSDQKPVTLEIERINLEDEELVHSILSEIAKGGVAGVIVNTVKRAQALAELVDKEDVELILLHSAFLAPERTKIEKYLQSKIGKNAVRPKKMVVIGTQVLEQSLDIDFDVLYTDISPMDLLLQRAGRLHRHAIKRPDKFKDPKLYVMGIESMGNYGAGNEAVYEKYLLMKTDYYLGDQIKLPHDISNLVQAVYDRENDPEVEGLEEAKDEFETDLTDSERKAKVFRVKRPSKRNNLHGWLGDAHSKVDDQKAQAAVRDIKETIEVILLQEKKGQTFLLDGRDTNKCLDKEIAEQIIRLPAAVYYDVDKIIDALETSTRKYFPRWDSSKWLKGELAVKLDEDFNTTINQSWNLNYSPKFGLKLTKKESNE
ncbi:CRISPR-associated helicase Cas3' [Xylocopilactobacillus apis]|uniref:CRISPR-associated helicase/endonuclease Cas3 n=1 Tax=Xylocopilactobacillus apis TaxID=2932183 RepID=A0AAU9D3D0_9LACO|nr:CRISPR-associated helicase Cas3' [Xylocopilactobacillus apis]BDR57041.1 CRISPR-associated helicase/endonuclease Cas3 [Xylocopilactobacillus apis]